MSQTNKLLELLEDGAEHSTPEILEKVYGDEHLGLARVSARILDLRKKGHYITGRKDKDNKSIYWYQLITFKQLELC